MTITVLYGDLNVAFTKKEQRLFESTAMLSQAVVDLKNLPLELQSKASAIVNAIDDFLGVVSIFPKQKALAGMEDHVKDTEQD